MTIVFQRALPHQEASAHAIIIGVGHYPTIAPPGVEPPDLESATRGAQMFADCLIRNADIMRPRLASVDILLSLAGGGQATYIAPENSGLSLDPVFVDPRSDAEVEPATGANVNAAGKRWFKALSKDFGGMAIIYACGHGVATTNRSIVLLEDAGSEEGKPLNPHIDALLELMRLNRRDDIALGCIFIDACQQISGLANKAEADGQRTLVPTELTSPGKSVVRNNCYLLVPGSLGTLAWDDSLKIGGRFTQVLVQALDGAAAYNFTGVGHWGLSLDTLHTKMKQLYGLNNLWVDGKTFNPVPISVPISEEPFIQYRDPPRVPVCVNFVPQEIVGDVDRLLLGPKGQGITQDFSLTSTSVSSGLSQAALKNGMFIVWPKVGMGTHSIQVELKPEVYVNGQTWPNATRTTDLDISEMRVSRPILHDVR